MRLTDLWDGLVSKPASAEDAAALVAREAAEGRRAEGGTVSCSTRSPYFMDPSLAEEVEPDDPEVDALAAQVAVETAAHQHGFPLYVTG
jgi:DMSO/TMAO reductase YedYZ molybdopterin-dependent catalytic subunit